MKTLSRAAVLVVAAVAIVSILPSTLFANPQEAAKAAPAPAELIPARVDKLFTQWNKPDSPGCALGVSRNGIPVYEHGYGMANLETSAAITPASVFHVASISKQFTAMSILLLAQRGKLSLDDQARKYVPELPDYGSPLTIRHLLTHTSGLRDVFLLRELAAPRDDGLVGNRNDALAKLLALQQALNFTPGAEFEYSNGGYNLLATIVNRVSGESLRAFAEANIFKPLGMAHTQILDGPTMIVPNRASGYHRDSDGLHLAIHGDLGRVVGNDGLFTTVEDLLLWEQNFAGVQAGVPDPVLATQTAAAAMQTPAVPTGWSDTSSYGFGLFIDRYRGLRIVEHSGGDPGYTANVMRFPDQGLAVAVLCNQDDINSPKLTRDVADIYLEGAFPAPAADTPIPPRVSLSAEQLASKAGLYRDLETGEFGRLFIQEGKLMAANGVGTEPSAELMPVSESRFVFPGTTIALEFLPSEKGQPQEVRVTGVGPKAHLKRRLAIAFAPSPTEMLALAGTYTSPELNTTYILEARDFGLVIHIPGRTDIALQPVYTDAFHGDLVDVVEFARDPQGAITGFKVIASGVRGLRFDRVSR